VVNCRLIGLEGGLASVYSDFLASSERFSFSSIATSNYDNLARRRLFNRASEPVEIVCKRLTSLSYISLCLRSFQGLSPIYISAPLGIHDLTTICFVEPTVPTHTVLRLRQSSRHMTFAYGMSACKSCTFYSRLVFSFHLQTLKDLGKRGLDVAAMPRHYGLHYC
jgi:hypothetical protein